MKRTFSNNLLPKVILAIAIAIVPLGTIEAQYTPTPTPTPQPVQKPDSPYSPPATQFQKAAAADTAQENRGMVGQINNIVGNQVYSSIKHRESVVNSSDITVASGKSAADFNTSNSTPDTKDSKTMVPPAPAQDKWGIFVSGLGGFTTLGSNSTGHSDVDNGGFVGGLDYRLTNNFDIGVLGSYSYTSFSEPFGHINDNGGKLGVYGSYFDGGWYGDFAVLGGVDNYNPHFPIPGGISGNYSGSDVMTALTGGYDQHFGALTVGPIAEFNYTYSSVGKYSQGFGIGTSIPEVDTNYFQTKLGGHTTYDWKVCDMTLTPELDAEWQHELGYQGNFTPSTFTSPYKIGRDSCAVGAGATLKVLSWWNVYAYYDGDLGRAKYLSNNVTIGTRISF